MKKLLALLLAALLVVASVPALADPGSEPDWTEYNALIDEIRITTDLEAREALMHQTEEILMDTGAICPLYYYNDLFMKRDGVEGFYANIYNTKFFLHATYGDNSTLRINLASEPDRLDPALNSTVDGGTLAANSFAGLYTYDSEGKHIPDLAEGYEVSEDNLTWVFTLKDDLKWSDGTELNAKDIEYSWKRAAAEETAADYGYLFSVIAGYGTEEGMQVTASDDGKTLTVVLNTPCPYFVDLVAFPAFFCIKQDEVESAEGYLNEDGTILDAGAWAQEAGFVTSGAYVLESWNHNESMVYVKNPYYWDAENVHIERLEFMLSADDSVIFAAYQAGNLDFIDTVPTDEIQTLLSENNPEFYVIDQLATYYISFNVKSPLFDGYTVEQAANIRKAISALIDRQFIVDNVGQTGQQIANTFVPAGMSDGHGGEFRQDDDAYTYPVELGYFALEPDVDYAIELLESAGFVFEDGMLSAETPLSFEYLTNSTSGHVAIAESIQQDLAVVGIDMTIKQVEWDVFLNERKAGNYDVARNGWSADYDDPINMLEIWATESGNNDAQFGR